MSHVDGLEAHGTPGAGSALLVFGSTGDAEVAGRRSRRALGLSAQERLALAVVGGSFLVALTALFVFVPSERDPGILVGVLYVLVYALASRIEFEVFTGASVPTQLVFVPILFVLPLHYVPVAVAAGLMLGSAVDWVKGEIALERIALTLVSSWHAIGPVVVLAVAGVRDLTWSSAPIYLLALASQFACELGAVGLQARIADRVRLRDIAPHLGRTQIVDAMLAPAGFTIAYAAQTEPYTLLLFLPLMALLRFFATERRLRIDNALELSTAYRGTAFLLGDVVEADDAYTGLHSRDVVELSVAVAAELGLSESDRRDTEFVALLHDVGKIRIPSEIINKPGKLDADEWEVMKTHTIEGERMLEQVGGLLGAVGRLVRSCHEHFDGSGYPDGLAGAQIPIVARIVMCCDAYSAMTTDRSYRRALSAGAAVDELRENAGTQFDPDVVDALVRVLERDALERPAARV